MLLENPRKPIDVGDLEAGFINSDNHFSSSAQPAMDPKALHAARQKLNELRIDRQDAEKDQNEFEMNELDQQILVLEKMLEDAAGFGGKASDINKSELTKMLKRIRDKMSTVYDKLAEEGLGAVAEHLRNSISASSGRAFIYEPGPGQAIQWDL